MLKVLHFVQCVTFENKDHDIKAQKFLWKI